MKKAIENAKYVENLGLDSSRKFVLHATVASLQYFQEICLANGLTIHDITKEYIANDLLKTNEEKK